VISFEEVMKDLEDDRCPRCYGTGCVPNFEAGIAGNQLDVVICKPCEGTGLISKGEAWK
jgi:DnaJ-class molecular chaperone